MFLKALPSGGSVGDGVDSVVVVVVGGSGLANSGSIGQDSGSEKLMSSIPIPPSRVRPGWMLTSKSI